MIKNLFPILLFITCYAFDSNVHADDHKKSEFIEPTIDLGCVVSDLEASIKFYTEAIGFKVVGEFNVPKGFAKDSGLTDSKTLNIKGRVFEINNFYEGISKFNFNELCDQNLGAEDYLEITKKSNFIVIENIPQFNDINSNQQLRFITLVDVIYDKNIPIAAESKIELYKL